MRPRDVGLLPTRRGRDHKGCHGSGQTSGSFPDSYSGAMSQDRNAQPASLRQDEAVERRALLDVLAYDVSLDLASDERTFGSVTRIRFTSGRGSTFVDL